MGSTAILTDRSPYPLTYGVRLIPAYNLTWYSQISLPGLTAAHRHRKGARRYHSPPLLQAQCRRVLANGLQIFPGSVPIYRGDTLVGGIGVSGDGVDQDDMISFLGLHNAGEVIGNGIGNAPIELRADTLVAGGVKPTLR